MKFARLSISILFAAYVPAQSAGMAVAQIDSFSDCKDDCPVMVTLPRGTFMMGSVDGNDLGHEELPIHPVQIGYTLAVAKYAVTFSQWDACVRDGGCNGYVPNDHGWGRGNLPVVNVSWTDAQSYVAWLDKKTGKHYRLLTEAEREYAARAGTHTRFYTGDDISEAQASYNQDYRGRKPLQVGSFPPNQWGLYDMHGNAEEWVEDCYHTNYENAPNNGSAWSADDCKFHVVRNGSWAEGSHGLSRASARGSAVSNFRSKYLGFRVALTVDPSAP